MAATTRQTSLLAQQDWTKLYQTFREADFQSYDYETLRKSMIDYLRNYYPEDFNDFTESSEYIALIDLIAFLGQSLAFRTDLNARENFIDTAERRDSILKLARLISYNPKRNLPATGYLKFDSISTTENITDSNGLNLSNLVVTWNDSTNDNWLEQFTSIINAALVDSQIIGKPGASSTINGIGTDEYSVSITPGVIPIYKFTAPVEGMNMAFEAVSATASGQSYVYEREPKPNNVFNILYRNDNQGNGSINTGFFLYFKQGELKNIDFNLTDSLPNRVVNINFDNINNNDVWLYSLSSQGTVDTKWTKVAAIGGINVVYNTETERNLYQVNTRASDQIDLVFGDGAFANIPQGNYRLFYRQSNGLTYKVTPDEMQGVRIDINYVSRTNRLESLSITASLNYTVADATAKESIEDIRTKAPQQYYTQNRMITGEDYNILPYTTFSNVLKVKAVNRSSSGISRYLDVLDTTGKYSSTNIFASDGLLYREYKNTTTQFSYSTSNEVYKIIYNTARPMITTKEAMHLYYDSVTPLEPDVSISWNATTESNGTTTGFFIDGTGSLRNIGTGATDNLDYIETGSLLRFEPPTGYYFDRNNDLQLGTASLATDKTYLYASVNSSTSTAAILSQPVPTGARLIKITPVFNNSWSSTFITSIATQIIANKDFGIRYNVATTSWVLIESNNLDLGDFDITTAGTSADNSWFVSFTYNSGKYTITQRNLYYYFESIAETRFYFDDKVKVYDSNTGTILKDTVKVLKTNSQPDSNSALDKDQNWNIYNCIIQSDGFQNTQKILITFPDANNDGIPDDPTLFTTLVDPLVDPSHKLVYFKEVVGYNSFINYEVVPEDTINTSYAAYSDAVKNVDLYAEGQVFYLTEEETFYVLTSGALVENTDYITRTGRQNLYFQYRHNSPSNRRIDPSPNNIMDLFLLTKTYNTAYQAWVKDTSGRITKPVAPTTDELRVEFQELENLKALSDTIIYNSAKFKPIFGDKSDAALRATFKVVKNPNVTISDNDVKSQVISAINSYFDITNWDFGETFYFSELSAYLHNKLVPNISSIIMLPTSTGAQFGGLYQINAEPNEIIISAATVDNVEIISSITAAQLNQTLAGLNTI